MAKGTAIPGRVWPAVLLVTVTFVVYSPTLSNGFVWDDNLYLTENPTMRAPSGLAEIWLDPQASPQYYPLTQTSFWIQYQLSGLRPRAYHAVNLLLHAGTATLLWFLLRGLSLRGAWLAAAVFALHPLQVESVAWVTERKNTLSGFLLMLSVLLFARAAGLLADRASATGPPKRDRLLREVSWPATLLFFLALTAKTAVATAPAALLVVLWWRRDRLGARDLFRVSPLLVLGLAGGLATSWLESHHVGAVGETWSLGVLEKILLAGRTVWFYAAKFAWPVGQVFIYPRWELTPGDLAGWAFPLTAAMVPVVLWALRNRIGKGPAAAVLAYGVLLAPASGFFDLYFFRYSYVQDHFQYFACVALAALLAGALGTWIRRETAFGVVSAAILVVLGGMSWQRSHLFWNAETLWRDTVARNPTAWMAHVNLATILAGQGKHDDAVLHYVAGLVTDPSHPDQQVDHGLQLLRQGDFDGGVEVVRQAAADRPYRKEALSGIGIVVAMKGRHAQALDLFDASVRVDSGYAPGHLNRGVALHRLGRDREALEALREAIRLDPKLANAHYQLALVLHSVGEQAEARAEMAEFQRLGGIPEPQVLRLLAAEPLPRGAERR